MEEQGTTKLAKKGTAKYAAMVWAGLITDPAALAEEQARRDEALLAAQEKAGRQRDGEERPDSMAE